ncbi:MAG: ferredoxin reductase family protein [Bacteroidota bacterium]
MNKKHHYTGVYIFWAVALLALPIWWMSYPETTVKHNFKPFYVYASQISALLGFSFFALSFVLSTRLNILEDLFGGLDKVYHAHHTMAKVALLCMVAHPLLLALRWVPEDVHKALWYFFPVHRRMEINIGSWALLGVVVLMFFTLVVRFRYHWWKKTHKILGVFFIAAVIHILLTDPTMLGNTGLKIYIWLLSFVGITAWTYKTLLFDFVKKKFSYRVTQVKRLSEKVLEIELRPLQEGVRFNPGQFCFFSFRSPNISREAHPYTITQVKENGNIFIMVKSLGDYTGRLYETLQPGAVGVIEGPYGRFDYKNGSHSQVWIGGGVGIAPFISWANDLIEHPKNDLKVDIFYCVNQSSEAIHTSVFQELQKVMPSARMHLICRDVQGFLKLGDVENIVMKDIFICGPSEMRKALLLDSKKLNISKNNIHYEDFDFV